MNGREWVEEQIAAANKTWTDQAGEWVNGKISAAGEWVLENTLGAVWAEMKEQGASAGQKIGEGIYAGADALVLFALLFLFLGMAGSKRGMKACYWTTVIFFLIKAIGGALK